MTTAKVKAALNSNIASAVIGVAAALLTKYVDKSVRDALVEQRIGTMNESLAQIRQSDKEQDSAISEHARAITKLESHSIDTDRRVTVLENRK